MTSMESRDIKKCRAIVMFGPAADTSGTKTGEYFQVCLDPKMVSPGGQYIRFGANQGDELFGWQRIEALTVCEILGEYDDTGVYPDSDYKDEPLSMRVLLP